MRAAFVLLVFLLVATQGCGPKYVLYNPIVDEAKMHADQRECEEEAYLHGDRSSMVILRRGPGEGISQKDYYESCMRKKGYTWVEEDKVPN
jgi:hypothetical protein